MIHSRNSADVARKTIEKLFSTGHISILDEHPGMESLRQMYPGFKDAFPDVRIELRQQVIENDRVACHWIFQGTHLGQLFGIPPTGRSVRFQNLSIVKVKDGKITQYNSEIGWLSIFMQIGVLPGGRNKPRSKP